MITLLTCFIWSLSEWHSASLQMCVIRHSIHPVTEKSVMMCNCLFSYGLHTEQYHIYPLPSFIILNVWYYFGKFWVQCHSVEFSWRNYGKSALSCANLCAFQLNNHPFWYNFHWIKNITIVKLIWFWFEYKMRFVIYSRTK